MGAFIVTWCVVVLLLLFRVPGIKRGIFYLIFITSFLLFHYPNNFLSKDNNGSGNILGAGTLVCNHVELVAPVLDKYIADKDLINEIRRDISSTLQAPSDWNIHGYSGDHCLWTLRTPYKIAERLQLDMRTVSNLLLRIFISGVINDPLTYLAKVSKQFAYAISKPYPGRNSIETRTEFLSEYNNLLKMEVFAGSNLSISFSQTYLQHPLIIYGVDLSWPGRVMINILHLTAPLIFLVFVMLVAFDCVRIFAGRWTLNNFVVY